MKNLGTIKAYRVAKETPLGYMISDGEKEYFLHRSETLYQDIKTGDVVEAFLYLDKKNRLAATLHKPRVTTESFAFAPVAAVLPGAGVFVDIGISKDILLSKDDLPRAEENWPRPGDFLPVRLKVKAERLIAKLLAREELPQSGKSGLAGETEGYVYMLYREGVLLLTGTYDFISVHTGPRGGFRLGQKLSVRITDQDERGYRGILTDSFVDADKEAILAYLRRHHGMMKFTDKSSPDLIYRRFKISKKAFKNALGRLYKEKRIEILPDKIILIE